MSAPILYWSRNVAAALGIKVIDICCPQYRARQHLRIPGPQTLSEDQIRAEFYRRPPASSVRSLRLCPGSGAVCWTCCRLMPAS